MCGKPEYRKRVKHFDLPGEIHFLTFSCYKRLPLLDDDWRRQQLSLAINRAMVKQGWRLAAMVYMPNHVHLLTFPTKHDLRVSKLLFAIKRPFSFRVKEQLKKWTDPLLDQLTIRQRPGVTTFRFWQEGPGYDRNIRTEKALLNMIDYLHLNPVRRGLVEKATDFRWSSARWYVSDGQEVDPLLPRLCSVPPDWFAGDVSSN